MKACCSSPKSICYWTVASVAAWVVLAEIGMFWYPLHASAAATCLLAAAVGCVANSLKNRTYHCFVTGPLFLLAGVLSLSAGVTHIDPKFIWIGVLTGTAAAFLLEWRYWRRQGSNEVRR